MNLVLDSDVIISGLISPKGAGNFILKNILGKKTVKIITSLKQIKEIHKVLNHPQFIWPVNEKLWLKFKQKTVKIALNKSTLNLASNLVNDVKDNHILSLCLLSKTRFLLTYNIKDYQKEKIKTSFDVLVVNPGYFLQFWRENLKH